MKFQNLLSSIKVGHTTLPNRMVMGAMHTRLETLDRPHERLAAFYATRAAGEISMILTGGYSPTPEGVIDETGLVLNSVTQLKDHRIVTSAVREAGAKIILQVLHAGRYAKLAECVAPSTGKARINPFPPRALSTDEVYALVRSYARTAILAKEAGYAGVEIMGSEGYLLNEFTTSITNQREDEYGGSFENRIRFPLQIIRAVREEVGSDFILIYRISSIDLMQGGMTAKEIASFARELETAGIDMLNTGIGWHESAVPTIAASVPRGAWIDAARNIKQAVGIPVMASNRINTPEIAEEIIASGAADLVSMARPLLADPDFAKKTRQARTDEINTCIACNQACLDHIFTNQVASCLVNPRAARELEFSKIPGPNKPKRIAVLGAGPAGMAFAVNASERGHQVSLYETSSKLGGQVNLAKSVPGKSEFNELLRYYKVMLEKNKVATYFNAKVSVKDLVAENFDEIIFATGVVPRKPNFPGIDHPKVVSYIDVLSQRAKIGEKVAIVGAGGIGFDVAAFLLGNQEESLQKDIFFKTWGVDKNISTAGGLASASPTKQTEHNASPRQIFMLQRKTESFGKNLGKTTGWILKNKLRQANVKMIAGVTYNKIDDQGLHFTSEDRAQILDVDTIILCSGQISNRSMHADLLAHGISSHLIGGAQNAVELDAYRAIKQATELACLI